MASYTPDVVEHIPGISNKAADLLSRRWEPGKVVSLPIYLTAETEQFGEPRPRAWWKAVPAM